MASTPLQSVARTLCLSLALLLSLGCLQVGLAQVRRTLPDDNLGYPVLVSIGGGTGSGFFLRTDQNLFFVTAAHVLSEPNSRMLRGPTAVLEAVSRDPAESQKTVFRLDLAALSVTGDLKIDDGQDVAVIRFGRLTAGQVSTVAPGIVEKAVAKGGLVVVPQAFVLPFNQVLVANPIIVFGYPTSIGIRASPQIDFSRPLLRSGIVAGVNAARKSIVIDAPVNGGNSGGPVLQRGAEGSLRIIGVVIQFVPLIEDTIPPGPQKVLANSGYGVAASMDAVLAITASFEK